MTWTIDPMNQPAMVETSLRIARRAVVADVQCYAVRVHLPEPGRWYDTRPMVDPRELSPECVDQAVETLAFGQAVGALVQHPQQQHLVRVAVCE